MNDLSEKLTVVIKTFERPDMVRRAVESLRRFHKTMPVIVADDSQSPTSFNDDIYTHTIHLPFDSGISFGRNRAIEKVETPYYLLIDDDHCFKKDCRLESLVDELENTDFDMIGMRMLNYRAKRDYCKGEWQYAGIIIREGDKMVHYIGKDHGSHQGYPIYDILLNCYAAKREKTKIISYDENIKIGVEHGDYFLQAKEVGLLVTLSHKSFIHHRPIYSKHYSQFRRRGNEYRDYYFNKHGINSEQTIGKNYTTLDRIRYFPHRIANIFWRILGRGR